MKIIINNYNRNVVGSKPSMNTSTCNCRNKEACPLNRQCQTGKVIYKVTFPSHRKNYKKKKYFGIAVESFKARPYNRNLSFRDKFSKSDADFSKELLQTKKKSYTPEITWRIIRKYLPYNFNSRKCYFCLDKKLETALYEGNNLLNKRN